MYNAQKNINGVRAVIKTYLLYTIILAIPCVIGMIAFSDQILKLLFNNSAGSFLLKISAISIAFIAVEQIVNASLQGIGKVFVPMLALSIGVLVKVITCMILIKIPDTEFIFGGTAGACVSTMLCHVVACAIGYYVLNRNVKLNIEISKYILKPLFSSCIMLVCLNYSYFLLKGIICENVAIILAIIIAGITYITSIFVLKTFSENELKMIPILSFFTKNKKK